MSLIINPRNPITDPFVNGANGGGELGSTYGWALCQSSSLVGKGLSADTAQRYSGDYSLKISPGTGGVAYCSRAVPVIPGQQYRVRLAYRSDSVITNGIYIRTQGKTVRPASGFITESLDPLDNRTSLYEHMIDAGISIANTWMVTQFVYTAQANEYWSNFSFYAWTPTLPTASIWFELLEFSAVTSKPPKVTTFTSSGNFTPDPAAIYTIVEGVGGGGGGGYGFGSAGANTSYIGCGGGSGAYVKVLLTAAQMGASQPATIGAGGVGGGSGGATSFGTIFTANGGAGGGGIYANTVLGGLTSTTLSPNMPRATFTINTGVNLGSQLGGLPTNGFAASATGTCIAITSDGADSEMGRGARGLRNPASPPNLNTPGNFNGQSAAANTGGGASGDATYSPNAAAGVGTTQGTGGSGVIRITEYYI